MKNGVMDNNDITRCVLVHLRDCLFSNYVRAVLRAHNTQKTHQRNKTRARSLCAARYLQIGEEAISRR